MSSISFEILQEGYRLSAAIVIKDTGIIGLSYIGEFIELVDNGSLILRQGFEWDGRSGPAIDTVDALRSSAVHDALYRMIRRGDIPKKYRKKADKLMRRIDKEDGVPKWRREYSYLALRWFGWLHAK